MKPVALDVQQPAKSAGVVHLLILESVAAEAELAVAELKSSGYDVQHTLAMNKEQFLAAVEGADFDAILADYRVSPWTGMDALRETRERDRNIPFLMLSGVLDDERAVECVKQGANDYISKEHLGRLPAALKRALDEKNLREGNAQAPAALAESEARAREFAELEMIYRTAPIGLAVYGPDLRYLRVNEQMARMNGVPAEKHAGMMTRDVNVDIGGVIEPYLRRVFARGESILNVELQNTRRAQQGAERSWLASFHPLRGASGVIFAISVVALEITERKRAEAALAASEARNREIVENSAYGIFRIAQNGAILDPNPALLRILGCRSAEELRPPALVRDVFRYPAEYAECLAACRPPGQTHGVESEWRRRDGAMVTVRLQFRGLSERESGAIAEVVAEDVTEVRAMERQLHHSQKFEAIGQLAGGVAHDFNNVVGAILGWAELGIEQSRSYPQIAERFARIREQAERAAGLTRELLAFARRQVLQPRMLDLNAVTSNLVSFLDKVLPKNIQLKVVNAPLDPVKADATQMEQVLMNLCLNARDAMPQGGRLIVETEMAEVDDAYCRFYPYVTPGRYAVLCVSDTGIGMDVETRERIFEPFFTTKEKSKSSGMGLATAYGVVKQHGGFIHVYSEPGQGSLFRVYLPAFVAAGSDDGEPRRGKAAPVDARGTETLLIAEDHDSIREMARQTLARLGYRVLSAMDGDEALQLCEHEKPVLAILDLVMPRMSGPELAAKLAERFKDMAILFTSGYSQESRGTSAGPNARFLQKPYSPSNLGRVVRDILDQVKKGAAKQ